MGINIGTSCDAPHTSGCQRPDNQLIIARQHGEIPICFFSCIQVGQNISKTAGGVLCTYNIFNLCQPLHRCGGQGISGSRRDIVKNNGHIHCDGYCFVMLIQFLLAGCCKTWGDNAQHVCPCRLCHFTLFNGFFCGNTSGTCINRNTPSCLLDYRFQNHLFFCPI